MAAASAAKIRRAHRAAPGHGSTIGHDIPGCLDIPICHGLPPHHEAHGLHEHLQHVLAIVALHFFEQRTHTAVARGLVPDHQSSGLVGSLRPRAQPRELYRLDACRFVCKGGAQAAEHIARHLLLHNARDVQRRLQVHERPHELLMHEAVVKMLETDAEDVLEHRHGRVGRVHVARALQEAKAVQEHGDVLLWRDDPGAAGCINLWNVQTLCMWRG